MDAFFKILRKKPLLFIIITFVYVFFVILIKWKLIWTTDILWFVVGSIVGLYLVDLAETFTKLTPSPFRTGLFCYLFVITSFFIITSSGNIMASGLVLAMYLTMILWQTGHLAVVSHLDHWYRTITGPMAKKTQYIIYLVFILIFILETFLFIQ